MARNVLLLSLQVSSTAAFSLRVCRRRAVGPRAVVRDESVTRIQNAEFHCEECRRSEELFFSFGPSYASDCPPSAADALSGPASWEEFEFRGRGADCAGPLDAIPPFPFGWSEVARVSKTPLFSAEACAAVIDEAEADAAWRGAAVLAHPEDGPTIYTPKLDPSLLLSFGFPVISPSPPTRPTPRPFGPSASFLAPSDGWTNNLKPSCTRPPPSPSPTRSSPRASCAAPPRASSSTTRRRAR